MRIFVFISFLLIHLYIVTLAFWEMGGNSTFCYWSNEVFGKQNCELINNQTFNLVIFGTLLGLSIVSSVVYILKNNQFKKIFFKLFKWALIPQALILSSGFYGIKFCLGFMGCSIVYLWPITVPLVLSYVGLLWIYVDLIHKNPLANNWSAKGIIVVLILCEFLAFGYVYCMTVAVSSATTFEQKY